jgi:hypothetical protein
MKKRTSGEATRISGGIVWPGSVRKPERERELGTWVHIALGRRSRGELQRHGFRRRRTGLHRAQQWLRKNLRRPSKRWSRDRSTELLRAAKSVHNEVCPQCLRGAKQQQRRRNGAAHGDRQFAGLPSTGLPGHSLYHRHATIERISCPAVVNYFEHGGPESSSLNQPGLGM